MNTPRAPSYDPFGEPFVASEPAATDRRLNIAAIAVFWTLATLLTAGRVYHHDQLPAPAQVAALSASVR